MIFKKNENGELVITLNADETSKLLSGKEKLVHTGCDDNGVGTTVLSMVRPRKHCDRFPSHVYPSEKLVEVKP